MKMYSSKLQLKDNLDPDKCAKAKFDISYTLLHDIILMEALAYTLKYTANKRKEEESIKLSLQER